MEGDTHQGVVGTEYSGEDGSTVDIFPFVMSPPTAPLLTSVVESQFYKIISQLADNRFST